MSIRLVFSPEMGWLGASRSKPITRRKLDVLLMSPEGRSSKEIAESLGIEYQRVKNNWYRLSNKLGAKNSVHALLLALNAGLITIEIISEDMDEDVSPERRETARVRTQKEPKKVGKVSKERGFSW